MKYELEKNNNSKKIIIGVSILFCTIILIIGGTFAFFTQSDNNELGNIVTTDINGTLLYRDDYEENNLYNRQGLLIPASLDVVLKTYKRVDAENKCLDMNNYAACSVYRFSIKNNSNVSQELIINLNPTANSYNNLKYLFFELKDSNILQLSENPVPLENGKYDSIQLVENFTLTPNEERMYELVFYVENQPYAQDDAGKEFGAGISINSVTTGAYVSKQYGSTCWNVDQTDPTKLISFNGINHDTSITSFKESVLESCSGYVEADEEGFIVTIPSTFNNVEIKSIGNMLLNAIITDESGIPIGVNKYNNIKKVIIEEGIERIEDGDLDDISSAFLGLGGDLITQKADPSKTLEVSLPNSLTYIGVAAFMTSALREINIPVNVETIGELAFYFNTNLTTVNFETKLDKQGQKVSALRTISDVSFAECNLTYSHSNPLFIPLNVSYIGESAFLNSGPDSQSNPLLEAIYYEGTSGYISGWYNNEYTTLYP